MLSRAYGDTREQIADAMGALLTCRKFQTESPDRGILALQDYRHRKAAQAPKFTRLDL